MVIATAYLSSDSFSGFLNDILFVWPLFGLSLKSILPEAWGPCLWVPKKNFPKRKEGERKKERII